MPRLVLHPATVEHDGDLIRWIPDAAALRQWAGHGLRWPLTLERLADRRREPGVTGYEARAAREAVGHGELVPESGGVRRLARILIAPQHRGRGFGAALIAALEQRARAEGAVELALHVWRDNRTAVRLYERLGFAHAGSPSIDLLRMRRGLENVQPAPAAPRAADARAPDARATGVAGPDAARPLEHSASWDRM